MCALSETVHENTARIVNSYAAARAARDYNALRELFHPDASFIMPAFKSSAYFRGECRGRDQICAMMKQTDTLLQFYDESVVSVVVEGNKAAVEWSAMFRNRGAGRALPIAGCAMLTIEDGKVKKYVHYVDTAAIDVLIKHSLANDFGAP